MSPSWLPSPPPAPKPQALCIASVMAGARSRSRSGQRNTFARELDQENSPHTSLLPASSFPDQKSPPTWEGVFLSGALWGGCVPIPPSTPAPWTL